MSQGQTLPLKIIINIIINIIFFSPLLLMFFLEQLIILYLFRKLPTSLQAGGLWPCSHNPAIRIMSWVSWKLLTQLDPISLRSVLISSLRSPKVSIFQRIFSQNLVFIFYLHVFFIFCPHMVVLDLIVVFPVQLISWTFLPLNILSCEMKFQVLKDWINLHISVCCSLIVRFSTANPHRCQFWIQFYLITNNKSRWNKDISRSYLFISIILFYILSTS